MSGQIKSEWRRDNIMRFSISTTGEAKLKQAWQFLKLEGEEKKVLQDILLSTAKVINLRVKSQARGQNNRSIALK